MTPSRWYVLMTFSYRLLICIAPCFKVSKANLLLLSFYKHRRKNLMPPQNINNRKWLHCQWDEGGTSWLPSIRFMLGSLFLKRLYNLVQWSQTRSYKLILAFSRLVIINSVNFVAVKELKILIVFLITGMPHAVPWKYLPSKLPASLGYAEGI